jgi:hypothetical protein
MSKRKRCDKGTSCRAACINRDKSCRVDLLNQSKELDRASRKVRQAPPVKKSQPQASEAAKKAAADILAFYAKGEPATTAMMGMLAKEHKMELVGLKHRLKGEGSLARKIDSEKRNFGGDVNKAAKSMSDVNRYTFQVPPGKYGDSVKAILSYFREQGYNLRIKNYWAKDAGPYRGLNVALIAPDGRKIEVQFHTRSSLYVKGKTHKDYEEFRVSKDNAKRRELWERMTALSRRIPMPKGAMSVGGPESIKKIKLEPV